MLDQTLYTKALHYAAKAHGDQKYPGEQLPYLFHVCEVAMEVIAAYMAQPNFDINTTVQVALLHDVVEDTEVTIEMIEQEFGEAVAKSVLAVTKNEALPKTAQMQDSLERILQATDEAAIVKLADRCANLRDVPHYWTNEKRQVYKTEAENIQKQLGYSNEYISERLTERIKKYENFIRK